MHTDLFEKIKGGDKKAFEHFFNTYYESLAYFAYKYVQDKEAAEDIVQDLFVKMWANRQDIHIKTAASSYLYGAVKNASFNFLKAKKLRTAFANTAVVDELTDPHISSQIDAQDLSNLIESSIFALPTERQKIFRLSREEGLKYTEIAEKLGISPKTVEVQMGKALKFLRERLKDFLPLLLAIISKIFLF